jgi:hypothetical protein
MKGERHVSRAYLPAGRTPGSRTRRDPRVNPKAVAISRGFIYFKAIYRKNLRLVVNPVFCLSRLYRDNPALTRSAGFGVEIAKLSVVSLSLRPWGYDHFIGRLRGR